MSKKLHAAVAKRTFGSEHVKKTEGLGAFFEVLMSKNCTRCGEKHIIKSKCTKHVSSGQFFEVLMSKN